MMGRIRVGLVVVVGVALLAIVSTVILSLSGSTLGLLLPLILVDERQLNLGFNLGPLMGMTATERTEALRRAVVDAGGSCERVRLTVSQLRDRSGYTTWNVICENDAAYSVSIANDGSQPTVVLPCGTVVSGELTEEQRLALSRCRP